ncbi:BLUF domain-containing protein [uncultured Mucilaginibacter sp.]|uniref:BLUF domain-containing protein n=1 Tax=uncultured Mucilaginibacter sp. TaxID=797541 RepID=UPI0025D426B5|nr:BLUF domain-containing protein [uncultured Mucilaginibacter sp.]
MDLYYILYISAGTNWFTGDELKALLKVSHRNNTRDGITGLLLYGDGNFVQLLEGEKTTVLRTFERISADPRHKSTTIIDSGELSDRNFPKWSMGFKALDSFSNTGLSGFLDPETKDFLFLKKQHRATDLLKSFICTARIGI